MRWGHVSDDDSQRHVKSNDFLYFGQLKLTVTVCPQCKAVYRSGAMEYHDTLSSHVIKRHTSSQRRKAYSRLTTRTEVDAVT